MRAAVLDVGSNTVRLLVADVRRDGRVEPVVTEKAYLGLGGEIASTGSISKGSLESVSLVGRRYAEEARAHGADLAEVIVTAPGRQGEHGGALVAALRSATGLPVRVLSAEAEGRLAFEGAVTRAGDLGPGRVGVVDVGGGSTEIAVGAPEDGAQWVGSIDLGSLRLARLALPGDPASRKQVAAARALVAEAFDSLDPPTPGSALGVGGSARALAKLIGRTFDAEEIDAAVEILTRRPAAKVARRFGIDTSRAETLLAGALILGQASRLLGPLTLAKGGLREGALLALVRDSKAAAA